MVLYLEKERGTPGVRLESKPLPLTKGKGLQGIRGATPLFENG